MPTGFDLDRCSIPTLLQVQKEWSERLQTEMNVLTMLEEMKNQPPEHVKECKDAINNALVMLREIRRRLTQKQKVTR